MGQSIFLWWSLILLLSHSFNYSVESFTFQRRRILLDLSTLTEDTNYNYYYNGESRHCKNVINPYRLRMTKSLSYRWQRFMSQGYYSNNDGSYDDDEFKNNNDDDESLFFDDFGDFVAGSNSMSSSFSSEEQSFSILSQRLKDSRQQDIARDSRLSKNWRQGNWKVRGFSLGSSSYETGNNNNNNNNNNSNSDSSFAQQMASRLRGDRMNRALRSNADDNHPVDDFTSPTNPMNPVHVSKLVGDNQLQRYMDEYPNIMVGDVVCVGRSDGSVCLVKLGSEYLAQFVENNNPSSEKYPDNNDYENTEFVRVEQTFLDNGSDSNVEDDLTMRQPNVEDPFEVILNFQAHEHNEPITCLLYDEDVLFTAGGSTGEIRMWSIQDDGTETKISPLRNLNVHTNTIVAMHTLSSSSPTTGTTNKEHDLLLTASVDGSFALWHLPTGDLIYTCHIGITNNNSNDNKDSSNTGPTNISIHCADVDHDLLSGSSSIIYFGLSTGHVIGYVASDIIQLASGENYQQCPLASCQFIAHSDGSSVTAIKCAGKGTFALSNRNNNGNKAQSTILLTGSENGEVKQWEMFARGEPSLTDKNFRIEQWPRLSTQRMQRRAHTFNGHTGPVTALQCGVGAKILSAGADGTIRVWNASKGNELFRMDGFTKEISSLHVDSGILVTDGMEQYVCVHDFDIDETEEDYGNDYLDEL